MREVCTLQGSAKRRSPGLVNIAAAVAYHFCLALPAAFTQPGGRLKPSPVRPSLVGIGNITYLHELEDGLLGLLPPEQDRDSGLVKVGGHKVNHLKWIHLEFRA